MNNCNNVGLCMTCRSDPIDLKKYRPLFDWKKYAYTTSLLVLRPQQLNPGGPVMTLEAYCSASVGTHVHSIQWCIPVHLYLF